MRVRALAIVLAVIGIYVGVGAPTSAAPGALRSPGAVATDPCPDLCTFDIRTTMGGATDNGNPGGQARGWGDFYFLSATKLNIFPKVQDICNSAGTGDGLGAYLWLQYETGQGFYEYVFRYDTQFKDDNGCGNGYLQDNAAITTQYRILRVRFKIVECDYDGVIQCFDSTWSHWKDNRLT